MDSQKKSSFSRNPVLWLVLAIPAATIVAGVWTLVVASGKSAVDADPDPVRRTAQVQIASIEADSEALRRKLSQALVMMAGSTAGGYLGAPLARRLPKSVIRALVARQPFVCPVSPGATLWLLSLQTCMDNLLHAAEASDEQLAGHTVWTLPALRVSIEALVHAFEAAHPGAAQQVTYRPDPVLEAQFGRLPPLFTPRADAAGFRHDGTVPQLVTRAARSLDMSTF